MCQKLCFYFSFHYLHITISYLETDDIFQMLRFFNAHLPMKATSLNPVLFVTSLDRRALTFHYFRTVFNSTAAINRIESVPDEILTGELF